MDQRTTIWPAPVPTLVRDAVAHMALRADDLPGWCNQKEPIAKALQTALGIRLALEAIEQEDFLTARAFRDYRRQTRRRYRKVLVKTPRLIAAVDDFEEPDRRFRYRPRLVVGRDDTDAARLVVTRAVTVSALADIRKERWRATIGDDFLTDWTIVKRVLVDHQSLRGLAQELGLDEKAVRKRFRGAIAAIAAAIGPVQWPESLSPHPHTYSRGPRERTGRRPQWRDQLHVHIDRPDNQTRGQVLAPELDLVARFLADGGAVQKLPDGLAVDFSGFLQHQNGQVTIVKRCAAYGADGKFLWVVSSRPQAAWDNVVPDAARYHEADLDVDRKWQGKAHADFEKNYLKGLQWSVPWQSKPTQRFAIKFFNCGEDGLLPGRKNGADIRGRPNRDCTGPAWEMWTIGSQLSSSSSGGVEPSEVRNDTRDLMARWVPPASYYNLTPEEMNSPFFE